MAEKLIIRIGSHENEVVHWLVWSSTESEIIASGELSDATHLSELSEKSISRKVTVLVPGTDVLLKKLNVPAKSKNALRLAAPYMLEDDIAQDVEQLFFAYADIKTSSGEENCFIATVAQEQMNTWQNWLSKAQIKHDVLVPEVLALPYVEERWQAIQLSNQIILRQGKWQGTTIDNDLWESYSQSWSSPEDINIDAYSSLPTTNMAVSIEAKPEELPLALMAQNLDSQPFNMLQGEYKAKVERSPLVRTWAWAAGFAGVALLLNVIIKSFTLLNLEQQTNEVEQEIIVQYKEAFPQTKRVRVSTIKSQLKRKLAEIGSGESDAHFLSLLTKTQTAFARVPSLKPESLKFDGRRNELRLQATAAGYQQFEQFKELLEKSQLAVTQGAQNNQGDSVSGSFSITENKGGRS